MILPTFLYGCYLGFPDTFFIAVGADAKLFYHGELFLADLDGSLATAWFHPAHGKP